MSCARGALTHLVWCLLTGCPTGGPFMCSPARTGRPGLIISIVSSLPPMTIMGMPADSQRMGVAGTRMALSGKPAVVGLATLEPVAP